MKKNIRISSMKKKAMEISPPNLVVVIILVLIVLVILLFVFGSTSRNFFSFITDLWSQGKGEKCVSPFLQRYCESCPEGFSMKETIPPPEKGWSDCSNCVECIKSEFG